jgi:predicted acyl esterase
VGQSGDLRELAAITWHSNGQDLVPSIAENPFAMLAHPRRELAADAARQDVVSLDGAPLQFDLTIAGPVELEGLLRSERVSTNLFARLLEVSESGHATLITRGQIHLAEVIGETPFKIRLLHAGYRVRTGHRLRLHLASSDFPEFVPNPGTGGDGWSAHKFLPNTTTISTSKLHPLKLTFTVLS